MSIPANVLIDRKVVEDRIKDILETSLDTVQLMTIDNDLVQKQVADLLKIDQRVYSNYETGKREIPTRFVVKLADFYKTSTDYILGRTNDPSPYKK